MQYSAIITTVSSKEESNQGRTNFLKMALTSVMQQTLPPTEILVVYDYPYGEGMDMETGVPGGRVHEGRVPEGRVNLPIPKHPDSGKPINITTMPSEGRGISASRNTGIKHSCEPWLAFLDDDDEWLPRKMEKQAELIKHKTQQGMNSLMNPLICHTDEKWRRHGEHVNPHLKHRKSGGRIYEKCLDLCCISPSTVLMQREVFDKYGLFDEKMPVCEDYDMWLRICAYEYVLFVPKKLTLKRGGHADQLSRKYWGMDRFRCYALKKMLLQSELTADYRQATKKALQKRLEILSIGARKRGKQQHLNYYQEQIQQLQK